MDRTPVIAGIGLSDYPVAPDLDSVQHHALAMQRALADCGVEKSAIDAYIGAGGSHQMMIDDPVTLAEYFRIDHKYIDGTMTGGSSFEFHVQHGAAAIREGLCDTILITYGSDQLSRMGRMLGTGGFTRGTQKVGGPQSYEAPYGNSLVGSYAMAALRHMHEYGTTSEQLGEIAAGVREFAGLNPNAMYRDPITAEDVVSSRMIADPLHKLDCCVISDGGGACVVTTEERARDLRKPAEEGDPVPLGSFFHLAAGLVLPAVGSGKPNVRDGVAARQVLRFRIRAEIADQDHFVDRCHFTPPRLPVGARAFHPIVQARP